MWHFASGDLEQQITQLSIRTVMIASLVLIVCTILALLLAKKKRIFKKVKLPLFLVMSVTLVGTTLLLFGSTIYLNTKAESKGPVHWHTDIEYWVCGSEIEFRDPTGFLSNKIGTATYHEHNDKRIHLEGVVVRKSEDAGIKKYMDVTGGYITHDSIAIPINNDSSTWLVSGEALDGDEQRVVNPRQLQDHVVTSNDKTVLEMKKGTKCGSEPAELQVFVYRYDEKNKTYKQEKLADPSKYVMRDEPNVPPGDCVIVEYAPRKERTDYLCEQYGVRDVKRCVDFGAKQFSPKICNIKEVTTGGTQ